MRMRREKEDFARDEAMHITTGAAWSDRMHSIRRSTGAAASTGARGPDSAFDGRQKALLDRRAEWAEQRRKSDELSPEDKKECTCEHWPAAGSKTMSLAVDVISAASANAGDIPIPT